MNRAAIGRSVAVVALALAASEVVAQPGRTTNVDCARRSLQSAIDAAQSGTTLVVEGICVENVRIVNKGLTLRASALPGPHGVQGVAASGAPPAIAVVQSPGTTLEGLSVSDGPAGGIVATDSTLHLSGGEIRENAGDGLVVESGSDVTGSGVVIDSNGYRGVVVEGASKLVCDECDLVDNSYFALAARESSHASLRDSEVEGTYGLLAEHGAYAEIDCVPLLTTHDCGLSVTVRAAEALFGGTVSLRATSDFFGQIAAFDRGEIQLLGAEQKSLGTPGFNLIDLFSNLVVSSLEDETTANLPGRLTGPSHVERFSRAVLADGSILTGTLYCSDAGDAWADSAATLTGSTITGCTNAVYP